MPKKPRKTPLKSHRRVANPTPRNLRHHAGNRNHNSDNLKLIRDPLNITYYFYTVNDITKLFGLYRTTVQKLILQNAFDKTIEIESPNQTHNTSDSRDPSDFEPTTYKARRFLIPAPAVLAFCTTHHNLYVRPKSKPIYIHPILIKAAHEFIDDYTYPGCQLRTYPLHVQLGTTDFTNHKD